MKPADDTVVVIRVPRKANKLLQALTGGYPVQRFPILELIRKWDGVSARASPPVQEALRI